MAFEVFKMFGSVLVNTDKAEDSIAKTEKKAESLGNKLGNGIKTAGKWGVAIGAGMAAAGTALFGMASKAAEATDEIDKMSQKIGISRQGYQEWGYVLSQNGMDVNSLQTGMKTLTSQFDDLSKGGKIATEAFGELGLSYEDLEGKSQEEVFNLTIEALQGMEDQTKRAAVANDLFGRSGSELAPLLNQTADSTENLKNKASELGIIMSDEAVDSGVLFTDTMDDLKRSFGAAAANVGTTLMPMIQSLLDWVIEHMPEIQEFMQTAFEAISTAVSTTYKWFSENLLPIIQDIYGWIVENWPTISFVMQTAFDVIVIAIGVVVDIVKVLWDGLTLAYNWITGTFSGIKGTFENIFSGVNDAIQGTIGWIQNLMDLAGKAINKVKEIGGGVKEKASSAWNWVTDKVSGKHEQGLDYVPYNGYVAELHQGERVLTKQENTTLKDLSAKPNHKLDGMVININGANIMDDYSVDRMMDRVMDRLAVAGVS